MLDLPVSTIRFWENEFNILKPMKNKKGNRMFTATDLKNLIIIQRLLKQEKMTIEGVKKKIKGNWEETEYKNEIYESLARIRSLLMDLRDSIQ